MKKVINGKVYNTETATHIAGWSNSIPSNDFGYCEEDLYVTAKGTYFLSGEGGAMSKYSQPSGSNGRTGGDGMEVLTKAEALAWCESHDVSADVIAENFEVEEG